MSQPSNLFSLSYQGVRAQRPPNVIVKNFDPSATASQNVDLGDFWINFNPQTPTQAKLWVLLSLSGGVAKWVEIASALGDLLTLTGDSGGAINPIAGNINILGDGTTIGTTGNNATGTITITATGVFTNFVSIVDAVASATAPADLNLIKTRAGGPINSGDQLGCVNFVGTDSASTQIIAASICSTNSGTIAANRVAGDLEFSTHPDAATGLNPLLRMKISSPGNVDINKADNDSFTVKPYTASFSVSGNSIISEDDTNGVSNGGVAQFVRTRNEGVITTGDILGSVVFSGSDGTNNITGAKIVATSTGTIAANQIPAVLDFYTSGATGTLTKRASILSPGNVGIGLADNDSLTFAAGSVASFAVAGSSIISQSNDNVTAATGGLSVISRTRNSTQVLTNDTLGSLYFAGYDTTNHLVPGSRIYSVATGTIAANQVPSNLIFTTANSAGTLTDRVTILSSGNVNVTQADNDTLLPALTFASFSVTGSSIISRSNSTVSPNTSALAGFQRTRNNGPILTGDTLGTLVFEGYDSNSAPTVAAQIDVGATGVIGAGQVPGLMIFSTASSTGVITARAQIGSNGVISVSSPDISTAALQVAGSISAQGDPGVGVASSTDFTNTTATAGGGAGAIALQADGVGVTQQGWLKIYVNGAVRYLPFYG